MERLSLLVLSMRAILGQCRRCIRRYLFALLDKLGGTTVDLPAPDEVVYNTQDKDESKDGAGPVLQRR
jgi:hypothetical protein